MLFLLTATAWQNGLSEPGGNGDNKVPACLMDGNSYLVSLREAGGTRENGSCPPLVSFLLGRKMDANRAMARDFALLKGVGPKAAEAIVRERTLRGGFESGFVWEEIPGLSCTARAGLARWTEISGEGARE